MLQVYVSNVSAVSNVCCKCFYLGVAYVVVAIHICCKYVFQMFLLFHLDVAYVAVAIHVYCIIFSNQYINLINI
jgi:hypothetical protein